MKKLFSLLLAVLMITLCFTACGGDKTPKYENLLVTATTVESDRFGMAFKTPEGYAVLTDDILAMAGDLDDEIQTGESYTVEGEEIPLRVIAMISDYVDGEYITFTIRQLEDGETAADELERITNNLGSEVTLSGTEEIEILGTTGYSYTLIQSFQENTFFNVGYLVQNGDYLLTILCSGQQFPVNTTEAVNAQLKKK